MSWIVIIIYLFSLGMVCVFSLEQLYLTVKFLKRKKPAPPAALEHFPLVTVQLPVYNEKYVVERLIDCICQMDYPKDKLEIQLLDDSTDDSVETARRKVAKWQQRGIDIRHIIRADRTGFKAGALQHGLELARGEYLAIFDADFLPGRDFLMRILPEFEDKTGMVQARWGHLNESYNLLTQLQAFGLNAHFTVEQAGRQSSGKLMNFNGTAGVWRKSCVTDAGGWQHDTLTEDLDLSYRAQLRGWQFKYPEHTVAPAELPVLVPAIKSQQYRWNKGAAETARKNLGQLLQSEESFARKLHGTFHLLNSSVFLFLLLAAVLSVPVLFIQAAEPFFAHILIFAGVFSVGFGAMFTFYWVAYRAAQQQRSLWQFAAQFPAFLMLSMGLSLHNALAVAEGYLGIKSPFIRTPKFNILSAKDSWHGKQYLQNLHISALTIAEGLLALYFAWAVVMGIHLQEPGLLFFHLMLTGGFGMVFLLSIKSALHAKAR